ncbi:DUF413 domain-containing protein [Ferrimonas balearica]|uniref:DUF413 domain-containing protein n=1 Tax=Ferrimonas balearica TaxID=44012 RepID=UPI001C992CCC|nr:DUF413 domain-containing protein [Ferrimonas balearica]MBY5991085.1 DUF413 domain-containing protein [Ferrimonas balearica]
MGSDSFLALSRFVDKRHPRGLARSGHFTLSEAERLERHGVAYQALCSGERPPGTEEEQAFVAAILGQREATTPHEKVWIKYLATLNRRRYSLNASCKSEWGEADDSALELDLDT